MIFPIGDDNSDRTTTPIVNYLLIAINVLVFVFFQGLGSNEKFTYAFSTVPEEIVTGRDLVTADRVVEDPVSGQRFKAPGLKFDVLPVFIRQLINPDFSRVVSPPCPCLLSRHFKMICDVDDAVV